MPRNASTGRECQYLGLDYEHIACDPVTLEDLDGIPHTFQFRTRVFSDQLSLDALETEPQEGHEFSVIADAEQDLFVTFRRLFERIGRELGRKHIEREGESYQITDAGVVRGQITSDPDGFDTMPLLIIDGRPVTWDEFGRMVSPHMGFRFKRYTGQALARAGSLAGALRRVGSALGTGYQCR